MLSPELTGKEKQGWASLVDCLAARSELTYNAESEQEHQRLIAPTAPSLVFLLLWLRRGLGFPSQNEGERITKAEDIGEKTHMNLSESSLLQLQHTWAWLDINQEDPDGPCG